MYFVSFIFGRIILIRPNLVVVIVLHNCVLYATDDMRNNFLLSIFL